MFGWIAIFALVVTGAMLIVQLRRGRSAAPAERSGWVGRLVYACMLIGLAGTAATGVVRGISSSEAMSGWMLIGHCAAAPLFAIGLAGVALVCAGRYMPDAPSLKPGATWFWLMLLAGLIVILSAVLPMTPMFGAVGQESLYQTHRYVSVLAIAFTLLHAGSLASRRGARSLPANRAAAARA